MSKSILLNRHCSLSVEAALLAMRHNIDIVMTDEFSTPVGRVWHLRPSSNTAILKEQLRASVDGRGLALAQEWVVSKLLEMRDFLKKLKVSRPDNLQLVKAIKHIDQQATRLAGESFTPETIRGIEGTASRMYFQALGQLLPEAFRFERRSRRPAEDLFNAALNYGYGLLYKEVDKALVLAGLSPFVGFLHRDGYQNQSLTFDFIEPWRGWVDRVVYRLVMQKHLKKSHCSFSGGVSLNIEGKKVVGKAINEYIRVEEVIFVGEKTVRLQQIKHFAQILVRKFNKNIEMST